MAGQMGKGIVITSSQNAKIKLVHALGGRTKERRAAGAFVGSLADGVPPQRRFGRRGRVAAHRALDGRAD